MRASESRTWTNTYAAAQDLGLTPAEVRVFCRAGYLQARRIGDNGAWRISRVSVSALLALREAASSRNAVSGGDLPPELGIRDAAAFLDVSPDSILRAVERGRLPGRKNGSGPTAPWRIPSDAVKRAMECVA